MDAPKGNTGCANPVFMALLERPYFFGWRLSENPGLLLVMLMYKENSTISANRRPLRLLRQVSCHRKVAISVSCNHDLAVGLEHNAGNKSDAATAEACGDLAAGTECGVQLPGREVAG
jgi:hypothetical protein